MKTQEQKKPGKGIILKLIAVGFALYILYSMISIQADINNKKEELSMLEAERKAMQVKNDELQKTLDSYGTDEFIEDQARDKLGYAYPDEHFYIDVSGSK